MDLNSWDYHELGKEMRYASIFKLLELFKREDEKYNSKCVEFVDITKNLNKEDRQAIEDECQFYEGSKLKIALKIAETLTK
ncbi:hypothetical protein [Sporosarcina sp. FSL W7-1283]|uniref:hypothetical protein n=1 Tax=Sporosarcina sp. FSL W7-1283 TaxID=2921560 RepID=UPI0030F519A7